MKLYRDGSVGAFTNYGKALSLSLAFGGITGIALGRTLLNELALWVDTSLTLKTSVLFISVSLFSFLMFIVYRRPLIILKNGKLIYFTGIFSSDYIFTSEIKKVRVFSDKESISVDIYNKANLRTSFETKALSNLDNEIKSFLEENSTLAVECVHSPAT